MKSYWFVLSLALLAITIPAASAYTSYGWHATPSTFSYNAGSNFGWQTAPAWNYQQNSHRTTYNYNTYQRREGYGLVPHNRPSAYPPRNFPNTQYCDNTELLGHTSAWRPGVYRSGMDGRVLPAPHNRPAVRNCPARTAFDNNRYRTPYW